MTTRRLLLLSNSTCHGQGLLDHAAAWITDFLTGMPQVLFVPWALADHDHYYLTVAERLRRLDLRCDSLHLADDLVRELENATALFIGGGNTFRLLKELQDHDLIEAIRYRVLEEGLPYVGSSAGTNVATPNLRTTNDMPIVQPASFGALGLVPFNINPHYLDADPSSTHMGETREQRLREFHEENATPVAGLREGTALRVEGSQIQVLGEGGARLFRRGEDPREVAEGERLDEILRI